MSQQTNQRSMLSFGSNKIVTVIATTADTEIMTEISYTDAKIIGNGSFGVVFQAKILPNNDVIAIKKVLQDRRFKNRELQIMRKCRHLNVVKLIYFFYSSGEKRDEVYLNLVLEFVPETLYKIERQYARSKQTVPVNFVRLYMYQLFRSLAYIHSIGICHRDIKPQNLLLDSEAGVLKLCDFGSAKQLEPGEPNVSYICSRYYRAPELIFGSVNYTTKIDMWSAGCVVAELLLGQLIFPGDSGVDQIVEIVKVMGTPTAEQLHEMNPNYKSFKLPILKPHPWPKVFRIRTPPEAIDLVSKLLIYTPNSRIAPIMACAHPFFDELRQDPGQMLPNGRPLPPLFNFTEQELTLDPNVTPLLLPKSSEHKSRKAAGADAVQVNRKSPSPRALRKAQREKKSAECQQSQPSSPQMNVLQVSQQQQQQPPQQQQSQQQLTPPPPPPPPPPQQQQQQQQRAASTTHSSSSRGTGSTHVNQSHRPDTSHNMHANIVTVTLQDIGNGDGVNMLLPAAPCENVAAANTTTGAQHNNNDNAIDDDDNNDDDGYDNDNDNNEADAMVDLFETADENDDDNVGNDADDESDDDDDDDIEIIDDDYEDDDEDVFNVYYSSDNDA